MSSQLDLTSYQEVLKSTGIGNEGANLITILDDCYLNLYNVGFHWSTQLIDTCPSHEGILGVTGFDRLPIINTISQRDNCKLR